MAYLNSNQLKQYHNDGYVAPINAITKNEANEIIFHAENLGSIPPNTAAVRLEYDNGKQSGVAELAHRLIQKGGVQSEEKFMHSLKYEREAAEKSNIFTQKRLFQPQKLDSRKSNGETVSVGVSISELINQFELKNSKDLCSNAAKGLINDAKRLENLENLNFCVFHIIWVKFIMGDSIGQRTTKNVFEMAMATI